MTSERHVLEVFERANPVPDPDLVTVDRDAGRFLTDLLDETTVVSVESAGGSPAAGRRRWLLPTIAAAIVAVTAAGLVLVVRDDSTEQVPVDTSPATNPDADVVGPVPATTTATDTSADNSTTIASAPTTAPTSQSAPVAAPTPTGAPDESSADVSLVESGETRASPVGDITWTRVDGDATNLPQSVDFEYGGRFYGSDYDGTSWRSDDGITWTEIDPLPGRPSDYVEVGDEVWTVIDPVNPVELPQLGRWDGTSFVLVDLPDLTSPDVNGLRVTARSLRLVPYRGELAIVASTFYGLDPANEVVGFGADVDMTEVFTEWVDDDTVRIIETSSGTAHQIGPDFTVAADPDDTNVLQIVSPEGMVVGRVGPWPGSDADQLRLQLRRGAPSRQRILIGDGGGFETLTSPQTDVGIVALADVDGQLLALMDRFSATTDSYSLWAINDLTEWTQIELPEPAGSRILAIELDGNGRGAVVNIVSETPQQVEAWFTDDGTNWQPASAATYIDTVAADFGWVMDRDFTAGPGGLVLPGYVVAVSADGVTWQDIPLDVDFPEAAGGWFFSVAANAIFLNRFDDSGERTIWIGVVHN